ncbi:MAG: DUF58 domain-containing protein [Chloroflexota bacterium]|nr:DUF58 domain-containing protein [Chloroflexota bacterium]
MNRGIWLGSSIVLIGALLDEPGLVLVGAFAVLAAALTGGWAGRGVRDLHYRRELGAHRALWGDRVPLAVELWNRKFLPVLRVTTNDRVTEGLVLAERALEPTGDGEAILQNVWSLLWYEKVVRHFQVLADHRGVFRFGRIELAVSDVFGHGLAGAVQTRPARLVVLPRAVPVRHAFAARAPFGSTRSRSGLFQDPASFAGVRSYQQGDSARQRHWRASARLGKPVTKRFEFVHDRTIIVVVDGQTVESPHWLPDVDTEVLEMVAVAAMSLARHVLADGRACGVASAIRSSIHRDIDYLPPRTGPGQIGRIGETLASMGQNVSAPFSGLIAALPARVPSGVTLVTVSARLPDSYLRTLVGLRRGGFMVEHVALGEGAAISAHRLRAAGIVASEARLDPDWRNADALIMAG